MSAIWWIADGGEIEQLDGSFLHQRTHTSDPYRSSPEPMAMADVGGKPVNWMLRQERPPSSLRWIHAELSINRVFQNPRKSVICEASVNEKVSLPECNHSDPP